MTRHLQCTTVRRLCPAFFARITNRRQPPGASPGAPFARIKLICIKLIPKTRGQPYYRNAFRVSARSSRPGGLFLLDSLVWAGRHWGPPSGPVRASAGAPASAPLARARPSGVCARASAVCGPVRPGLRRSGPLCAAPACAGVPCRRRGPPAGASGRPLAVVVGGWCPPPRRLGGLPVPGLGAGGGAPPRGPGLVLALAWCRPVLPTRRRGGALGPAAGWPSLLAPAPSPRGLRAAAAYRQPPLRQHVGHGIDRRHGTALMIQRTADPLDVSILRHKVNCVNLPCRVGAHVLRQSKGPGSPLDVLPDRLPCLMAPTG